MLKRRFIAFVIDYLVILLYATFLWGLSLWLYKPFDISSIRISPVEGQVLGLVSLTIPVFLYHYLMESSSKMGTIGKLKMGIQVAANKRSQVFWRNLIKFLPWELAHLGVHQIRYFSNQEAEAPIWIWLFLLLPQLLVIMYLITIFRTKGTSSLYDRLAGTTVAQRTNHSSKGCAHD